MIPVIAAMVLMLGGCGEDPFDPAASRPCDFFTEEELDKYVLQVEVNESNRCRFGKTPPAQDTLTHVTVEYRDSEPATVAAALKLPPVDGQKSKQTTVAFKGSIDVENKTGTCAMVAPIGRGRSLVVGIGTDTGGITWVSEGPKDDPCDYVAYQFKEIEAKLRRD
ncbi:hypothetical protein GCM10009557_42360 [Virgisporangium ochraceum]|uniref:DUF3558 domain-containing protein n=1 Tax=Virgisporangium ochraceum TaxID=65505 RepID=A0A8J4EI36_9ACTN|nr:hypothetical protein [Virgisporangium ochraceum]GIJ75358.1 hypothetical protein Voc01_102750 [Virgisporangium ochraceum]